MKTTEELVAHSKIAAMRLRDAAELIMRLRPSLRTEESMLVENLYLASNRLAETIAKADGH